MKEFRTRLGMVVHRTMTVKELRAALIGQPDERPVLVEIDGTVAYMDGSSKVAAFGEITSFDPERIECLAFYADFS